MTRTADCARRSPATAGEVRLEKTDPRETPARSEAAEPQDRLVIATSSGSISALEEDLSPEAILLRLKDAEAIAALRESLETGILLVSHHTAMNIVGNLKD
ncbi:MAG: hypothetical protein IT384_18670 [Deltaproteobacteria bacterium]|nr:hypothetical protein [Deltaproteobacteria bacterium]